MSRFGRVEATLNDVAPLLTYRAIENQTDDLARIGRGLGHTLLAASTLTLHGTPHGILEMPHGIMGFLDRVRSAHSKEKAATPFGVRLSEVPPVGLEPTT